MVHFEASRHSHTIHRGSAQNTNNAYHILILAFYHQTNDACGMTEDYTKTPARLPPVPPTSPANFVLRGRVIPGDISGTIHPSKHHSWARIPTPSFPPSPSTTSTSSGSSSSQEQHFAAWRTCRSIWWTIHCFTVLMSACDATIRKHRQAAC